MNIESLKFAIEAGLINEQELENAVEVARNKMLLNMHPYKIWQGKNGDWYTYFEDVHKGRKLKKRKNRSDLEKDIIDHYNDCSGNPTIAELFTEWNDRRLELGMIAPSTYDRYIRDFNRHYKDFGKRKIKSVSKREYVEFLEEQVAQYKLDSKAFCNLKTITRGFFKRALVRDIVDYSAEEIFCRLDLGKNSFKHKFKEDYQEVFNDTEMSVMLGYIEENLEPTNIAIGLMFITGLRVGELVALRNEDLGDFYINVRGTETRYRNENGKSAYTVKDSTKTNAGIRTIPIPSKYKWLLDKAKELNPSGEYVFLNTKGERMTGNSVRTRLKTLCKKLDIYNKSPNKIRKTYGSILLDNKVDDRFVKDLMGHTVILTTETHYHRNRKSLTIKQEILSNLPDFK